MKSRNKLALAVAAIIVSAQIGDTASARAPNSAEAIAIAQFLKAARYDSLYAFLRSRPDLMEGDSVLARELQAFAQAYQSGTSFAFSPDTLARIEASLATRFGRPSAGSTAIY
jgi:type IV secretory pathway ATPase VirB11/archaellum biosynthesis ATPase